MIFDSLTNAKQYAGLNAGIDTVLKEAVAYTAENFPKERRVLDGDALFMNFVILCVFTPRSRFPRSCREQERGEFR